MKKNYFHLLFALFCMACTTGCNTVNTVENVQKYGQRQMVADQRIITDTSLNRKVSIVGVSQAMTPGGLLKVQVEVLNPSRSLQTFSYRWEWFDEVGIMIDTAASVSITRQIEGRESLFITGLAPKETARDFRLKLIEAAH